MRTDEAEHYDFELPPELIAQQPVAVRSDARLLVVCRGRGELEHAHVRDLPDYVLPADCLVVNDSRVIPARLWGYRQATGGRWQGLFLSSSEPDIWRVLCKTRGKLQPGERITLVDRQGVSAVSLRMLARLEGGAWAVRVESGLDTWELLQRVGRVPLPPYIRRGQMVEDDLRWYQTVYADRPGSVAAPTAGLHLTDSLLHQLQRQGTRLTRVTLHVGLGTFRPLAVERLDAHEMHAEWGELTADTAATLNQVRADGGRIVAVGTTSVRVLESAAAQLGGSASAPLSAWSGETRLFIRPPYNFRAVDVLLTNFHLPRSTLLVLVRTLGGDELIRRAYAEAIRERYRFYSYGDAMLILP